MTDGHRAAWKRLRALRLAALAALLILPPAGIALTILLAAPTNAEGAGSSNVGMFACVIPIAILVRLIIAFECPECRKPFSSGGGTGTHLTNKRCVHCGLVLGG